MYVRWQSMASLSAWPNRLILGKALRVIPTGLCVSHATRGDSRADGALEKPTVESFRCLKIKESAPNWTSDLVKWMRGRAGAYLYSTWKLDVLLMGLAWAIASYLVGCWKRPTAFGAWFHCKSGKLCTSRIGHPWETPTSDISEYQSYLVRVHADANNEIPLVQDVTQFNVHTVEGVIGTCGGITGRAFARTMWSRGSSHNMIASCSAFEDRCFQFLLLSL